MSPVILIFSIILGVLLFIILGTFASIYNSLVRLKNNIEKAWSNIDVLLKQRHDELPKLIATVKGYMKHEKDLLLKITQARAATMQATGAKAKAAANNVLSSTLKSLFAVAENYPDLKANQNFLVLQKRISEIEDMIADRREFYNDSVTTFNTRIEQIPSVFIARMLGYSAKELFKADAEERADVKMDFHP